MGRDHSGTTDFTKFLWAFILTEGKALERSELHFNHS